MNGHVDGAPDLHETTCCIVGAGPAGAMLALLLARQGVPVKLLEAHRDFDRDFRGDSVHPAILELLDEIGLADRVLAEVPHRKIRGATLPTEPPVTLGFSRLRTRFPFMTLMPQARFLEFLTAEAARLPSFELAMQASVRELVTENGIVRGVRYRAPDGPHELRATLTVGTDGRFSQVRRQSGLRAVTYASPIDVLWFRLPRLPADPEGVVGRIGRGQMLLMVDRGDQWQIGTIIPKDGFSAIRAAGLEALHRTLVALVPWLEGRVSDLDDWKRVSLLSVQIDRLPRWWLPGLLLLGDAAHVMSPVAGNGINYAVQDAVAAANLLTGPLAAGRVDDRDLAAVQRRRDWPVRLTQFAVAQMQERGLAKVLSQRVRPPNPKLLEALLRVPLLGSLPLRLAAFGVRPEHVRPELRQAHSASLP
jgi:2-polyprenyl-6-methoxyphenol hydroxylase-like FAD-dependent oxidoreductase